MIRLETRRLTLRSWTEADIADLVEGLNDLEVAKWLALVPHPYARKDAEDWIQFCIQNKKAGRADSHHFAIELRSERKVIGGVTLDRISTVHGTAGGRDLDQFQVSKNGLWE